MNINQSSVIDKLKEIEERLLNDYKGTEGKVLQLSNLSKMIKNLSYIELQEREEVLKSDIQKDYQRIERIQRLLNKISEERKEILKLQSNSEAQEKLFIEREKLEKSISTLELHLNKNLIKEEEIEELITKEEMRNKELFFTNNHFNEYKKSIRIIERYPKQIDEKKKYLESLKRRIDNRKKYLEVFQDCLGDENEPTSLNSLNNAIQSIYNYVRENNIGEICPVCSANKGKELSSEISKNIQKNLCEITKKSNKISKINNKIEKIRLKIKEFEAEILNIEKDIKTLENKLENSNITMMEIQLDNSFNKDLFEREEIDLNKLLDESHNKIKEIRGYKMDFYNLKSLKNRLKELSSKMFESDYEKKNKLESRSYELQRRKRILENLDKIQIKNKEEKQIEEQEIKQNMFLLSNLLLPDQINTRIQILIDELLENNRKILLKRKDIKDIIELYQKLEQNNKIDNEIKEVREKIYEKQQEVASYECEIGYIDEHRDAIYKEIGNEAAELLNKPDSSIQKYFRYLNPVPSVNKVLFNSPNSEELEIILDYENKDSGVMSPSTVQYSLSSGQLYVLAISIFLAINEAQNVSRLNFIGIDDPIQNMDDVNQFSICDVLSTIDKQLIFSTHDLNFLQLYLKKNKHKKESIQVFMLEINDDLITRVNEVGFTN